MDRITNKQLQYKVDYINGFLNRPMTSCTKNGKDIVWNIGHIFIDSYSPPDNPYRYKLAEVENNGGEYDWTNYRMTRKEFYAYLVGIIDGLERSK